MGGSANISAAQGIQAWLHVFDRSANQTGSGDLVDGMVGMNLAAAGVKANVAVLRSTDEMLGSLLDMQA